LPDDESELCSIYRGDRASFSYSAGAKIAAMMAATVNTKVAFKAI
jgi:hypothetical protein